MRRTVFDTALAFVALAAIVFVVSVVDIRQWFGWLVGLSVLLVLSCYLIPRFMTRIISAPQAFRLERNYGKKSFEMQLVSYSSYHTTWLADVTHIGFLAEAVAWYVMAFVFGGYPALIAVSLVKSAQIVALGDRRIGAWLAFVWLAVPVLAVVIAQTMVTPTDLAVAVLVGMPAWRVIGHLTEPVPPGVSGGDRFVPLEQHGLSASLGVSFVVGYLAEFASGLPHRLADVWIYDVAIRAGSYQSTTLINRSDVEAQRKLVFEEGWGAARTTAALASV